MDEEMASLEAEFPEWHMWCGVAGLLYASRANGFNPIVVRAYSPAALRERIKAKEAERGKR